MKQPYKIVNLYFKYFQSQETDNNFSFAGAPIGPWSPLFIIPEEKNVLIKKITGSYTSVSTGLGSGLRAIKSWKVLFKLLDKMETDLQTIPGTIQNPNSGSFIQPAGQIEKLTSINSYKPFNNFNPGIIAGGIQLTYIEWTHWQPGSTFPIEDELNLQIYYQDID